ncbi:MAG: DUF2723 domain-containing protein [Chloroflexota bacterium]|nr:DUF2723 domain-containing protein [Chloroflexota bacterium]
MRTRARWALPAALLILLIAWLPTLQTIPNGSEHYFMIDVGETQIVLNVWGTLHATGYPLYVMLSSALVSLLRTFGMDAVTAPAVTSLLYGIAALALLYVLALRLTGRPLLVAGMIVLLGLVRTVWVHQVIAEIYSFGLLLMISLLALALWQPPVRHRLYWLALLGGIGVAHHRAIAMMIPALLYAVYPDLRSEGRRLPRALLGCLALGLLGFAQYLYLPLRANANAAWVYGEPGTWAGLWDQFIGAEASRFIGTISSFDGLLANIARINTVLVTDLTLPGIIVGLAGLLLALGSRERRRLAIVLLLNGGVALLFHYVYYTDILSALILPVLVSLALGWVLAAEAALSFLRFGGYTDDERTRHAASLQAHQSRRRDEAHLVRPFSKSSTLLNMLFILLFTGFALVLSGQNQPFIRALTHDTTGLETIALVRETPTDSALMLAWGPRHFAVGLAQDVWGELPDVTLVDHKADFASLASAMPIFTPAFTFYNQPVDWWQGQIGAPVYLHAAAPQLVAVATQPEIGSGDTFGAQDAQITCTDDALHLTVAWYTPDVPERDLSVFVHLLDVSGAVIAQGDQNAPVYGWRPLTTWQAGEVVRDVYMLPRLLNGAAVRYGLYFQPTPDTFENVVVYEVDVRCGG